MPRKHFHSVALQFSSEELSAYNVARDDMSYDERRKIFLEPHHKLRRADGLLAYIALELRAAKIVTTDPRIAELHIHLTNKPRDVPTYYRHGERWDLNVDIDCPAAELLAVPVENDALGEFFISVIKRGLDRASDYPELPRDLIMAGCEQFRKAGFAYPYVIGEDMIAGTKVKGCLTAKASCVLTARFLTVSYRGKQLFKTELASEDGPNLGLRHRYGGFAWKDDEIVEKLANWVAGFNLPGLVHHEEKIARIDLNDFPEARDFIRTKLL